MELVDILMAALSMISLVASTLYYFQTKREERRLAERREQVLKEFSSYHKLLKKEAETDSAVINIYENKFQTEELFKIVYQPILKHPQLPLDIYDNIVDVMPKKSVGDGVRVVAATNLVEV